MINNMTLDYDNVVLVSFYYGAIHLATTTFVQVNWELQILSDLFPCSRNTPFDDSNNSSKGIFLILKTGIWRDIWVARFAILEIWPNSS
jgi:hypothetical protein